MAGEYFQPNGNRVKHHRLARALMTNTLRHRFGSLMLQQAFVRSNLHMYKPPGFSRAKRERMEERAGSRTGGGGGGCRHMR